MKEMADLGEGDAWEAVFPGELQGGGRAWGSGEKEFEVFAVGDGLGGGAAAGEREAGFVEDVAAAAGGGETREIGAAIQHHAEREGFGVVRTFCGHAIGREFHGDLSIPHYDEPQAVTVMEPGMTFTIEPMITMGSWRERIWPDGWTAVTADGLRTAQFEHTMVVTDEGVEVLTPSETLPAPE